jgi:hypothetical protein
MTANPYESPETVQSPPPRRTNLPRVALSVLAVVCLLGLLIALLLPARRTVGETARRMQCGNHLKQIALALQNYADTYKCLPPAYTVDAAGNRLHSWRTLILPFNEQQALYDQIDLSKPWDDPANKLAYDTNLSVYVCPSGSNMKSRTTYFAVNAPGGCFQSSRPLPLAAVTDNHDLTLMVIEVSEKHAIHWMSPNDATESLIVNRDSDGKFTHPNGAQAVCVSGRTMFLKKNTPAPVLRALISIDGNDDNIAKDF